MACFIDNYQDCQARPTEGTSILHISASNSTLERHWLLCREELLRRYIIASPNYPNSENLPTLVFCHTSPVGKSRYSLVSRVSIYEKDCSIKVETHISKSSIPVVVAVRDIRLMMMRFLWRLNAPSRVRGFFKIHPMTGLLTFTIWNVLAQAQYVNLLITPRDFVARVEAILKDAISDFSYYFWKLLHLIGEVQADYMPQVLNQRQCRPSPPNDQSVEFLQKCLWVSDLPFDSIGYDKPNPFPPVFQTQLRGALETVQENISNFEKLDQQFSNFNLSRQKKYFSIDEAESFLRAKQPQLMEYLRVQANIAGNQMEKKALFCQIHVQNADRVKWELISEGGFSIIEGGNVSFVYVQGGDSLETLEKKTDSRVTKELVRKREKDGSKKKLAHQRAILETIANKWCPYIMKFYWSKQKQFENVIFMDRCKHKSLENLLRSQQAFLSPANRIYLMYQAAQALRFLKANNIVHLDIKPANMLIGRSFTLRLSDFGESYHSTCCPQNYHPGYTLPYSSPEIFSPTINFHHSLDTYSFGMMLFGVVFQKEPLERRRRDFEQVLKDLGKGSPIVQPERRSLACSREGVWFLQQLGMKCLNADPKNRSNIEWAVIMLRGVIDHFQKVY